jgi:hypothetical protein
MWPSSFLVYYMRTYRFDDAIQLAICARELKPSLFIHTLPHETDPNDPESY